MLRTQILLLIALTSCAVLNAQTAGLASGELLITARTQFSLSVEDEEQIEPARKAFHDLLAKENALHGRALVYLGALSLIEAKHSAWPHIKLQKALDGLELMDKGLQMSPDDVEALFVHGTICHQLPFFFSRSTDAQNNLRKMMELLPTRMSTYDSEFLVMMFDFFENEDVLSEEDLQRVESLRIESASTQKE